MVDRYSVEVDRALCIACNVCVVMCDNFEMVQVAKNEEKSQPKQKVIQEHVQEHMNAKEACPTAAISVKKVEKE